jgi:CDP-glucose 4,6-dehydratase
MMRSFMADEIVTIRNPASTRPWQHVLEPLRGYLLLAERLYDDAPRYAEAWNFGPDDTDARPVEWLANRVCELWGPPASWSNAADNDQPHEAGFLRLNCDKAKSRLGWQPRMNLQQALAWTVNWYRGFQQGDDVRTLTEQQITDYETGKDLS